MKDFIYPATDDLASSTALVVNGVEVPAPDDIVDALRTEPRQESSPSPEAIYRELQQRLDSSPGQSGAFQGSRLLPRGAPGKRIVFFPSRKNGGSIPCESRLEAEFCLLLEAHPEVERFRGQAVTFYYSDWWYTPDFVARLKDGRLCAYEVKPTGLALRPKVLKKLLGVQRVLASCRIGFRVVTETAIQAGPNLYNLKYVYQRSSPDLAPELALRVRDLLKDRRGCVSLQDLRGFVVQQGWPATSAESLVWLGHLTFDRSQFLRPGTALFGGAQ